MAYMELHFFSDVLERAVSACVILPEQSVSLIGMEQGQSEKESEKCKTLWLLHGLSDDHTIWMRRSSIERYAAAAGIAVVMPDGERSWYNDLPNGGGNYFTYITEELPAKCRSIYRCMSDRREDNFIGGLSMGGYGALKAAYTYPERYGGVVGLSSALLRSRIRKALAEGDTARYQPIFGDVSDFEHSPLNVFHLAEAADPAALPPTYLWCGDNDPLLPDTLALGEWLEAHRVPVNCTHTPGSHAWQYWDAHIGPAIEWLLSQIK